MIDSSNKKIKDIRPFLKFFDFEELKYEDKILIQNASVFDTLRNIEKVVKSTLSQTKKIANHLKGKSLEETLRNNWHFVHDHIQYEIDKFGIEQIRTPLRLIKDKKGDCDCFSTFFSSLLTNQGIEHSLRMTKYNGDWQHVYVIVPKKGGYYTLDAVLHSFNKEEPFTQKFDKKMQLQVLNGLGNLGNLGAIQGLGFTQEFNTNLLGLGYVAPSTGDEIMGDFLARLKQHLYNTKRIIQSNLNVFEPSFVADLDYLLDNYDHNFYGALNVLADSSLSGFGLGFFKKIKAKVQQAATFTKDTANKVGDTKVGQGIKKVGQAIVKYNPVTILIRNGFYLAMRMNFLNVAGRLYYGSLSEEQAQRQGLNMDEYRKLRNVFNRTKGLLVDIGADESNFYKWFNKGVEVARRKGKIGSADTIGASDDNAQLDGLGEPATTTGVAAASGVLAKIWAWLKDIDFSKLKQKVQNVANFVLPKKDENVSVQAPGLPDSQDQNVDIEPISVANNLPIPPVPTRDVYAGNHKVSNSTTPKKSNMGLMVGGAIAVAGIGALLFFGGKKKPATKGKKSLNGTDGTEGLDGTKKRKPATKKTTTKKPVATKKATKKTATKTKKVTVKI